MSFDLAVWHPDRPLTNEDALGIYRALCDGDVSGLQPNPAVAAFHAELTATYPEIDEVPDDRIDDQDFCPWSAAHARSDRHVIMCCVWPKADDVKRLVLTLAGKHGLAVFDPQDTRISYPGNTPPGPDTTRWWNRGG
jgi:hypothetical protein